MPLDDPGLVYLTTPTHAYTTANNITRIDEWLANRFEELREKGDFLKQGVALTANILRKIRKGRNEPVFHNKCQSPLFIICVL